MRSRKSSPPEQLGLGLDPVAVHKLNAVQAGDTSVHGWKIGSTGLRECLDLNWFQQPRTR